MIPVYRVSLVVFIFVGGLAPDSNLLVCLQLVVSCCWILLLSLLK